MFKYLGVCLIVILTAVGADYIGRHGWSDILGIPLVIIVSSMVTVAFWELFRKDI